MCKCGPLEALDLLASRCVSLTVAKRDKRKNAAYVYRCTRSSPANVCHKWNGFMMLGPNWFVGAGRKGGEEGVVAAAKNGRKGVVFGASKNPKKKTDTVLLGGKDNTKSGVIVGQNGPNRRRRGLVAVQDTRTRKGIAVGFDGKKIKTVTFKPCTHKNRPIRDKVTNRCISTKTAAKRASQA